MQKAKRYIRPNVLDYILVALAVLLAVTLLARGLAIYIDDRAERDCTATVSFVIHGVSEEIKDELVALAEADFLLPDGTRLSGASITELSRNKQLVQDADGNFVEFEAPSKYDVTYTLQAAAGERAKDGTFLLGGSRRLAVGDRMTLLLGDARYTADFIKVRIL